MEPVISWEPWQRAGPDRRKESKYFEIRSCRGSQDRSRAAMTRKGAQQEFDGCV